MASSALVIALFRVQYNQYCSSFLLYADLFHEPLWETRNHGKQKNMRKEEILVILHEVNARKVQKRKISTVFSFIIYQVKKKQKNEFYIFIY